MARSADCGWKRSDSTEKQRKSNPVSSCTTVSTAVSSGSHPSEPNPAQQMANACMQVMMNAFQQTFQVTRRQKANMPTASAQGDSPKRDAAAAEPAIDKSPMDTKTPQLALEDKSTPKTNALLEVAHPDPVIPPSDFDPDKLHEAFKRPAAANDRGGFTQWFGSCSLINTLYVWFPASWAPMVAERLFGWSSNPGESSYPQHGQPASGPSLNTTPPIDVPYNTRSMVAK